MKHGGETDYAFIPRKLFVGINVKLEEKRNYIYLLALKIINTKERKMLLHSRKCVTIRFGHSTNDNFSYRPTP